MGLLVLELRSPFFGQGHSVQFLVLIPVSAIFIAASLISWFIIKSIRKSLRILKNATRRVAEGDLDFSLAPGGRDDFASLMRSFDQMRIRLKDEYSRRSRFLMGVSHDLKTPLSSITGYLDALSDGMASNPEQAAKFMAIMREKAAQLEQRISHLIEYVKMETGQWQLPLEETDASSFLKQIVQCYREESEFLSYNFFADIRVPDQTMFLMDRELVTRVFENLMHNAVRYSGEEKKISISAEIASDSSKLSMAIENTGPGIQEQDLPLIFEPFYRGNASRNQKGFGLGLASVRAIIDAHGWTITVSSKPGEKTAFSLTIPLAAATAV